MRTVMPPLQQMKPPPDARDETAKRVTAIKQIGRVMPETAVKQTEAVEKAQRDDKMSRENLNDLLEKSFKLLDTLNSKRHLKYEVIEEADLVQVQVVDDDTGNIVRKIPADEVVKLVKRLNEMLSGDLDVKA